LCDLAFIPVRDVANAFEELLNTQYFVDNEEVLQLIIDYFEETWIGRTVRRRRRDPILPLEMWNCYNEIPMDFSRTTNVVEGWHHAFNTSLGSHYTTIWKYINFLKIEQGLQEAKIEKISLSEINPAKKRKYKDLDKRLKNVRNYDYRNLFHYLKGIAHNFNF